MTFREFLFSTLFLWIVLFGMLSTMVSFRPGGWRQVVILVLWVLVLIGLVLQLFIVRPR